MKNLIPFVALLVLGGSFCLDNAAYAGEGKGKKCSKAKCEKASGGDDCCKEEAKGKDKKASKEASADKPKEGDAPAAAPAENK